MGRIQNYNFLEFISVLIDYQAFITIEQRPTSLLTDLFKEMFNTLMKIKNKPQKPTQLITNTGMSDHRHKCDVAQS